MSTFETLQHGKTIQKKSTDTRTFIYRILSAVGRILAFLAAILLCLPVILLPLTTAVPAWVWISLGILDIGMVIVQFRIKPAWRGIVISLAGLILLSLIAVVTSQYFAQTPPIVDEQGRPIPGSIATLEKINLNGREEWISIRGEDASKPILLNLGMGGPGGEAASPPGPCSSRWKRILWLSPGTSQGPANRIMRFRSPR